MLWASKRRVSPTIGRRRKSGIRRCCSNTKRATALWKKGAFVPGVDGIAGSGEAGDGFGAALAWGDFYLEGYSDLAVAAPNGGIAGETKVGIVHVIYGSASGLSAVGDTTFHQDTFGVAGGNKHVLNTSTFCNLPCKCVLASTRADN